MVLNTTEGVNTLTMAIPIVIVPQKTEDQMIGQDNLGFSAFSFLACFEKWYSGTTL